MNSPKDIEIVPENQTISNSPEKVIESGNEKHAIPSKLGKKTISPEFSIDSLILRKNKDINTGNWLHNHQDVFNSLNNHHGHE